MIGTAPDTYSAVISIRLLALLWDDCGNMGQVMVPVRTHGAASGVLSMIGGGNFGSGFVSGAVASGIGSIPHSSDVLRLVKLVSGSVAGGLVAYALGGRFIQGAIQGLKIGFFNHYVHDTRLHRELMQDANGNLYGELAEFVCEEEESIFEFVLYILGNRNWELGPGERVYKKRGTLLWETMVNFIFMHTVREASMAINM